MDINNLQIINTEGIEQMTLKKEMPAYLEHTKLLIEGKEEDQKGFGTYSKGYIKTTENIDGYFEKLYLYDKKLLTVVGAGDQIFTAVLDGAREIDGFDISMNSIMLYYLKEAAIKTLDYDTFLNFFFVEKKCFDKNVYERIRPSLNEQAVEFWDMVFSQDNPLDIIGKITHGGLYSNSAYAERNLSSLSGYLSRHCYEITKQKIKNCKITIHLKDVKELDDIGSGYDYIILSNIFQYQKGEDLVEFKKAIERYKKLLTPDGLIVVGYAYNDVDLTEFSEYEKKSVPSRFSAWGSEFAPDDAILVTGKNI